MVFYMNKKGCFKSIFFTFFIFISILLVSCTTKPPRKTIVKVIMAEQIEKPINLWADKCWIEYEEIGILQYGKYNSDEKYWPVKVSIKGTQYVLVDGKTHSGYIDKKRDLKFGKDDYGEWCIKF